MKKKTPESTDPYRIPLKVTQVMVFRRYDRTDYFPICPRCKRTLEREYQSYCDRCGQCLNWKGFSTAEEVENVPKIVTPQIDFWKAMMGGRDISGHDEPEHSSDENGMPKQKQSLEEIFEQIRKEREKWTAAFPSPSKRKW